jgi:hypothetical protein
VRASSPGAAMLPVPASVFLPAPFAIGR